MEKERLLSGIAQITWPPSPPNSFVGRQKLRFAHMTEEKSTEDDDVGFNDNHDGDAEKDTNIVTFE